MINLNDVLLAASNIPVDDPIAEIWGRGLQGGYKIIKYTGTLPIIINANGEALLDYRIYGADGGVGEPTENLFDKNANDVNKGYVTQGYLTVDGAVNTGTGASSFSISEYISLPSESETIFLEKVGSISAPGIAICFYDDSQVYISGQAYGPVASLSVQKPSNATLCRFTFLKSSAILAYVGTTAPTSYVPYGYRLPIISNRNLFDALVMKTYKPNYYKNDAGIERTYYGGGYFSYYIPIANERIYVENFRVRDTDNPCRLYFYDSNMNWISRSGGYLTDFSIVPPIGAMYIQFQLGTGDAEFSSDIVITRDSNKITTPVYIGDNQLDAGEYVSYGEQKIYRDVGGTLTPTDPPVPLPEIPTINGETVIDYDGDPKPSQMYVKYKGKG